MLNFYGRKSPRRLKKKDLESLFSSNFFFHEKNISNLVNHCLNKSILNLEIGFGSGENILQNALKYDNEIFIGCDPYLRGALFLKKNIEKFRLNNLNNLPISDIDLLPYEERLNAALIGGDDYELLFTSPPVHKEKINKIAKLQGLQITNIGYIKNGKNGQVTSNNRPINIDAYKHF